MTLRFLETPCLFLEALRLLAAPCLRDNIRQLLLFEVAVFLDALRLLLLLFVREVLRLLLDLLFRLWRPTTLGAPLRFTCETFLFRLLFADLLVLDVDFAWRRPFTIFISFASVAVRGRCFFPKEMVRQL